ncbi:IPT/TIG domain-containing protein [Chitinophaga cymbidii]|uniref:IPT/TIG domain-containing protein n=1 Tax=Chitinophaga cymbidii TaxID=1096750 RepID=A0A512RFF9_9BACT|nr:IPT/TIG domain-containing protein [Chitinophaga cymbidii]GEP94431.1 hypothetical protein CCY01nite_06910 [Chitinophaga cymbidii]
MKANKTYNIPFICCVLLALASSCKREREPAPGNIITPPVITGISRNFVQAGDTISIYGSGLQQASMQTEVAISGRSAEVVHVHKDSLRAVIPINTHSGRLMISISLGKDYISIYGPELSVAPTPSVLRYWPLYAYPGDTVAMIVKNFSDVLTDNLVMLDHKPAKLVSYNGSDTLKLIVPEGAVSNRVQWRTYKGPMYSSADSFPVRQVQYDVANILEWLEQDPAYSYMHAVFNYGGVKAEPIYDTLLQYLDGTKPCAVFLPVNDGWRAEGLLTAYDLLDKRVRLATYQYVNFPLASLLPGASFSPEQLTPGQHATALNQKLVFPNDSWTTPDKKNHVQLEKQGDDWYIQQLSFWGPLTPLYKVQRVHQIGDSYLYEITNALMPYDTDYY